MDNKHKAMALGSIAKTVSGIFVDLVDFDASKIPASEIDIKAIHWIHQLQYGQILIQ